MTPSMDRVVYKASEDNKKIWIINDCMTVSDNLIMYWTHVQ